MRRPAWTNTLTPSGWTTLLVIVAAVVIGAWLLHGEASRHRAAADRAKAEAAFSQGRAESGAEAVETVVRNARDEASIDQRVKDSQDAIRNSPDPDRAAVNELCRAPSARRDPRCAVLDPRP